jgi:hypothetical protein
MDVPPGAGAPAGAGVGKLNVCLHDESMLPPVICPTVNFVRQTLKLLEQSPPGTVPGRRIPAAFVVDPRTVLQFSEIHIALTEFFIC